MTSTIETPRDKLDTILAYARRALHYWWLIVGIVLVGGALSVLLALAREPRYESEMVLFHNERINTQIVTGRNEALHTRNLGDRYRELLMSRTNLSKVVEEFNLYPDLVADEGIDSAVEELRLHIDFRFRGSGAFRISFQSSDPELAQRVTQRLGELVINEDERIRREQAMATREFAEDERASAEAELKKRERALAEFLAAHPEFAAEDAMATGAGIRAAQKKSDSEPIAGITDPQLLALERQRRRLASGLDAPAQPRGPREKSPERLAAEQQVAERERELEQAQQRLNVLLAQYTERHPDVISGQQQVATAQTRLRRAQATLPLDRPDVMPVNVDKDALRRELRSVEREIAAVRARIAKEKQASAAEETPAEEEPNWVVALETQFAALLREVNQTRETLERRESAAQEANVLARQQMAEQGATLSIIDQANLPKQPVGKGKRIIVMAGVVLFGGFAMVLALGLALIDDRLYRRGDLERLGVAPVLVSIPKAIKRKRRKRG